MGIFSHDHTGPRMPRLLSAFLAALLLLQTVPFFAAAEDTKSTETSSKSTPAAAETTEAATETSEAPTESAEATTEDAEASTEPEETVSVEESHEHFFPDYTLEEYADVMYGTGTIKDNGCSVCCMAVVATYLTGHQYYPDELARWFGGKAENNVDRIRLMAKELQLPMT